jgi:hypothetical protein
MIQVYVRWVESYKGIGSENEKLNEGRRNDIDVDVGGGG